MFETVVIATDGSESAERAEDVGLDLAERFGATVHALCVLDTDPREGEGTELLEGELRRTLAALGRRSDVQVETDIRSGDPAVAIREFVTEVGADVVVLGTRGRHGPHKFHLGSVAEAVVAESPVPVLTVRQLGDEGDERG